MNPVHQSQPAASQPAAPPQCVICSSRVYYSAPALRIARQHGMAMSGCFAYVLVEYYTLPAVCICVLIWVCGVSYMKGALGRGTRWLCSLVDGRQSRNGGGVSW